MSITDYKRCVYYRLYGNDYGFVFNMRNIPYTIRRGRRVVPKVTVPTSIERISSVPTSRLSFVGPFHHMPSVGRPPPQVMRCMSNFGSHKPAIQPSSHLAIQSSSHPVIQPSSHPAIQSSSHPVIQPSSHPVIQSSSHPAIQPSSHPVIHPTN